MQWCKWPKGTEFPQALFAPWNSAQRYISMTLSFMTTVMPYHLFKEEKNVYIT